MSADRSSGRPVRPVRGGRRRTEYRLAVAGVLVAAGVVQGSPAPAAAQIVFNRYIYPDPAGNAQLPAVFNIAPGGFDAASPYVLKIDGVPNPYKITGAGGFMSFTASPSCGLHDANISLPSQGSGSEDLQFAIACITPTPASIPYSSEPRVIPVTGEEWVFNQGDSVILTLDGKQVATAVPNSDTGEFLTRFVASGLGCAPHTLTASEHVSTESPLDIIATTQFTVTNCPAITVNPTVITEGLLTHVTGTGFTPNQPITLSWQNPAGAVLSACSPNADSAPALKADATGKLDTYCFARPHQILGAAQIAAVQGAQHAAAPVVVEGGSMQPSTGDQFVFRR